MDAQRWAVIQGILDQALDLLPDQRAAYLDRACGSDVALKKEVEDLIAAVDDGLDLTSAVMTGEPEDLGPGSTLQNDRYRILGTIGRGGMGEVYKARDTRLNREVSLKRLLLTDTRARTVFTREAHLLARLKHPRLPTVTDSFFEQGRAFFVMEYVPGRDLWDELTTRDTPFDPDTVRGWTVQLLETLDYLHTYQPPESTIRESGHKPIVHRDIKPSNLKLHPNGRLYLLDFGIAQSGSLELTRTAGPSSGLTPHYAPPEQFYRDTETTARSDLFALGATLYTLLTGDRPPKAETRVERVKDGLPDPLKPVHATRPDVPRAFSELIFRAMSLDPRQRPPSAAAMLDALNRLDVILDETVAQHPPSTPPSTPSSIDDPQPRRLVYAAAGVALLVVAALAYAFNPFTSTDSPADSTLDTLAVTTPPPIGAQEGSTETIDSGDPSIPIVPADDPGDTSADDTPREQETVPPDNEGGTENDPSGDPVETEDPVEQEDPVTQPADDPPVAVTQVRANFAFRDTGNPNNILTRGSVEVDGRRLIRLANQTLSAGEHCFRVRQDGYIPTHLEVDGARVPFEGSSSVCVDVPASTDRVKIFIHVKRE